MDTKRFVIVGVVVFVAMVITDYILHQLVLKGLYESLTIRRPQAEKKLSDGVHFSGRIDHVLHVGLCI